MRHSIIQRRLAAFCCAAGAILTIAPASAAVDRNHTYDAVRAQAPPHFDISLSDPSWHAGVVATTFEDLTTRRPEPLKTTAYLLYDEKNLYVAFRADQDGVPIHAEHSTNNVGFGQDDAVGVCVDTSGAGTQVYCFETTPRGVRYQQASESTRYAPPWDARAEVDGSSWTAMLVIPLRDLRAAGGTRTWRFNFIRVCAGTGDHYTWAYDGLMQDAQPPQWPTFTDARWWPQLAHLQLPASATRPLPRAEVYGLESVGHDRNLFQQANGVFAPQTPRNAGVDFTYPITGTIAAVGALNPDFSNVEVDQQTIVPQEFPRNLTEYRPFFAQGAQYFTPDQTISLGSVVSPPNQVFYTPSIGTFDRGFKLEGTEGTNSFGALEVRGVAADGSALDDEAFGFKHVLSDRTFLYWVNGALAHHDIGDDSTVDEGIGFRNLRTGLVWGFHQALEQRRISFDPGDTFAYQRGEFIDVHKPNYELFSAYEDFSPGYGPIDGFTAINDARGPVESANFTAAPPGVKSWTGFFGADRFLTRGGIVHEADFFGNDDIITKNQIHYNVSVQDSELDDAALTCGQPLPFDQTSVLFGYHDGTPAPIDLSYSAGHFSTPNFEQLHASGGASGFCPSASYLQQFNIGGTRPIGSRLGISGTYAGTHIQSPAFGTNGQLLRSLSVNESLGPDTDVTLALRAINGRGGFALPGLNFAGGFHNKFRTGSELFVNFGTPAASVTINRLIIKYVMRFGGGAGT